MKARKSKVYFTTPLKPLQDIETPETPMTEEYIQAHVEPEPKQVIERIAAEEGKTESIVRLEKKFDIEIDEIVEKTKCNGYYNITLRCKDGSTLTTNVSEEDLQPMKLQVVQVANARAARYHVYEGTDIYQVDANNDGTFTSCPCSMTQQNCRHLEAVRQVDSKQVASVPQEQTIAEYHDPKFKEWIEYAVNDMGASPPVHILRRKGKEYWGRADRPFLYYMDADGYLNCFNKKFRKKKQFVHRVISSCYDALTEQDSYAVLEAAKHNAALYEYKPE